MAKSTSQKDSDGEWLAAQGSERFTLAKPVPVSRTGKDITEWFVFAFSRGFIAGIDGV